MIRTYEGVTSETAREVARRAFRGFRKRLSERPGFVAYELLVADDTIVSISVFESWVVAEETSLLARRWIEQNLGDVGLPEPRVVAGELYSEAELPPPFAPSRRATLKLPLANPTEDRYR